MIIEFRVENHRSIREEQVLSFEAARLGDPEDPRLRNVDGYKKPLLPVIALYGANASGKSSVLGALDFMRRAVSESHRLWAPDEGVPREPFSWGEARQKPSLFELTFIREGVRYQYGFVCDDERFLEEWLFAWPRGRKQRWFERDGQAFQFGEHFSGPNEVVAEVTRRNALFASTGLQLSHGQLEPLGRQFADSLGSTLPMNLHSEVAAAFFEGWIGESAKRGGLSQSFAMTVLVEMLQEADLGISDIRVADTPEDGSSRPRLEFPPSCSRSPRTRR